MALSMQNGPSYEYLVTRPIYELLDICKCWKELQRELRGG